jgi:hypothetical protein
MTTGNQHDKQPKPATGYTSTGKWTVEWLEAQDLPSLPRRETLVAICKLVNAALAAERKPLVDALKPLARGAKVGK